MEKEKASPTELAIAFSFAQMAHSTPILKQAVSRNPTRSRIYSRPKSRFLSL